jgi:glutaredoxin-like protein
MFTDRSGEQAPNVTFHTRKGHEWVDVNSCDIFTDRTVVVFALPGAFTPTCSSAHVPRYNQLAPALAQAGVDEIVCIAVNDPFVMNQWKEEQRAENVTFLPDGNGAFSKAMGMLVPMDELSFGQRSWRYSMVVRNGTIEKMFIEPNKLGDPFEVSDADTMLEYLAPASEKPVSVSVFSRPGCSFCSSAKDMLKQAGLAYEELVMNRDYTDQTLRAVAGSTMVPQVYVNGSRIGGSTELADWLESRAA